MKDMIYKVGYFEVGVDVGSDDTSEFNSLAEALHKYNEYTKLVDECKLDATWLDCCRDRNDDCPVTILTYDRENKTDLFPEFMSEALTREVLDRTIDLYWDTPWSDID